MKWHEIQEAIDNCDKCKPSQPRLLAKYRQPARPPEPTKKDILFISEAPPREGGFWEQKSDDALRRNLCSILSPGTYVPQLMLDKFRTERLTLVQTLKWPFLKTSIAEIRHSAISHIIQEISFINPREIIALGGVAGRALQILYPDSNFAAEFKRLKTIGALRGGEYIADRFPIRITYLPSDRMWHQQANKIRLDIVKFIRDANEPLPTL